MKPELSVGYETEECKSKAQALSDRLKIPVNKNFLPQICVLADKLVLKASGFSPLVADFNSSSIAKRVHAGKSQGLFKACKPKCGMKILDATAGWGRDAAVLASFGASLLLIERNQFMHALLEDGIRRERLGLDLKLVFADAKEYLESLQKDDYPDVIYIDPMHPEREKSALVKKDMQILQSLIGADDDAQALISVALKRSSKRVVVKWPARKNPLIKPDFSVDGKTVRFDVYLCHVV